MGVDERFTFFKEGGESNEWRWLPFSRFLSSSCDVIRFEN